MKKVYVLVLTMTLALSSCKSSKYADLDDGVYADIQTTKGDIVVKLEFEKTPITVANFVSLAEGTNTFVSDSLKGKKYFDGIFFTGSSKTLCYKPVTLLVQEVETLVISLKMKSTIHWCMTKKGFYLWQMEVPPLTVASSSSPTKRPRS